MTRQIGRRELLKSALAATAAAGLGGLASDWVRGARAAEATMPTRRLGKTGHDVSIFSLGGVGTLSQDGEGDAGVEIVNHALDLGVNYIDTAADYGSGLSESRIGEVMKERRDEVFLATKSHVYDYDGVMRMCEESLERLQTDHLDLYQHHRVQDLERLDRIAQPDGALRAFEQLRDEGVVRHLGITSHTPHIMTEAIDRHDYDCVLITINPAHMVYGTPYDADDLTAFLAKAAEKDVGVIAMKVLNSGNILERGVSVEQALRYALSREPVSTACVGITELPQLDENVEVARSFEPLSAEELAELEELAQD
ncbi:MAG: aldo/keto reductase [Candidatus Hydrogenedentota bacterium]